VRRRVTSCISFPGLRGILKYYFRRAPFLPSRTHFVATSVKSVSHPSVLFHEMGISLLAGSRCAVEAPPRLLCEILIIRITNVGNSEMWKLLRVVSSGLFLPPPPPPEIVIMDDRLYTRAYGASAMTVRRVLFLKRGRVYGIKKFGCNERAGP